MKKGQGWLLGLVVAMLALYFTAAGAEEAAFQPADLPVVYLTIDGGAEEIEKLNTSPDHSYRCTGMMDLAVPEGYGGDVGGRYPQESLTGLKMEYIRGRGNGTWGMAKLPYKIKLAEKQDLFGMGTNKVWILVANYFDNSLMRNRLTEWMGEEMGLEYTPEGVFVEVVMNGDYLGCYYLCESVRIGKNRVAIDELKEEDTALPAIRGGYLLEFFPDDYESPDSFETARGLSLGNGDPSFDLEDGGYVNDAQKDYIRDYIQKAEDAIFTEGGNYADYLDLQSLADYWWIQEFSANGDAFRTDSAHMFKKRTETDGSEGKLHFGPLWDFDESWGNCYLEIRETPGFNNTFFLWTDELRTKPEFQALLAERWQVMEGKLEEMVREGGVLDQTAELIRGAWQRDQDRWKTSREEDETGVGRDLAQEVELIRGWINLRRAWINGHMDRIGMINCTLTVRVEGQEDTVYELSCDNSVSLYDIDMPEAEGRRFVGWALEDGTVVEDFIFLDRDMTLTAVFEDEES